MSFIKVSGMDIHFGKKTQYRQKMIFFYDGFIDAIKEIVPAYSPFGETEISIKEWTEIGKIILTKDSLSQEVYNEANEWLKGVFTQYECFTILGL